MSDGRPARVKKRRVLSVAVFGLLALALGGWVWSVSQSGWRPPPLPRPNGHDDLVRAAAMVVGEAPNSGKYHDASADELRPFVDENREALAAARIGLGRTCRVPLAPTLQAQIDAGVQDVGPIRRLARLFDCEARLARREGHPAEAARAGLDLVRLGREQGRGGLMIQYQTGCAIVTMGVNFLAALGPGLDGADCRTLARALEADDAARETAAEVLAREHQFARSTAPWNLRLFMTVNARGLNQLLKPAEDATELAEKRTEAMLHLLIARLALRAYRLEHEEDPAHLAALVPGILAAVPADPFTGRPLVYIKDPGGFRLYSLGPDGLDDGGRPIAGNIRPGSRGDLVLAPDRR
jgi:hypothetical protein